MNDENKLTLKKLILPMFFLGLTVIVIFNNNYIVGHVANLLERNPRVVIAPGNDYTRDQDFLFVQRSETFIPFSRGELLNIFFSVLNNGWERFTFYCPVEYRSCLEDLKRISENQILLSHINNFVHPFNSFQSIETTSFTSGQVNLRIERLYSSEMIYRINNHVDEVIETLVRTDMTKERKIKVLHDHILENAVYDQEFDPARNDNRYRSNTAYGVFFQGNGICSGFSDAMTIFLDRLGVKNFRIASVEHVWNALLINDDWLHLDVTWNAPIGLNTFWHRYFLITTEELRRLNTTNPDDHYFDRIIYLEFRN